MTKQMNKMEQLIADNFIELEVELGARRKQYEYYRDKLLTFKVFNSPPSEGWQAQPDGVVDGVTR